MMSDPYPPNSHELSHPYSSYNASPPPASALEERTSATTTAISATSHECATYDSASLEGASAEDGVEFAEGGVGGGSPPSHDEGDAVPIPPPRRKVGGHSRSASHGGVLVNRDPGGSRSLGLVCENPVTQAPLPVRASSLKGHQRAFSHGQATSEGATSRGHKREGSRTEFILPEGHEERERERRKRPLKVPSSGSGSWKKGHRRQASHTESLYSIRNQKKSLRQRLCFWRKTNHERCSRLIVPNHIFQQSITSSDHPNNAYISNKICTRKYSFLTFLPKNLFEQFHRFANLYFLFIVLLNFVPSVNAFAPMLSMLPLVFVLGVTAIKDIFEDYRRYVNDKDVNNSTCRVYSRSEERYIQKKWKEVYVGDILHLSCDEIVPADMVLINGSDEDGVTYIESSNLDGEINLKQRQCVRGINKDGSFNISQFNCVLEVGPPTTKMYHFVGTLGTHTREQIALTKDNFIPRDCFIKNTGFVEGIVVYAGRETKAMLNNGGPRYKRSKLEKQMNREVLWCVAILLLLCVICAIGAGFWQRSMQEYSMSEVIFIVSKSLLRTPAESLLESPAWVAFTSFWSFIIIFQVMIPISLYVTIEIIKLMQVYHIQSDEHFFDEKQNKTIRCRALNINEELGQVQYIFADKTGTLTENKMVFQRCSINGVDYCHEPVLKEGKVEYESNTFSINSDLQEELTKIELQTSSQYSRINLNRPTCNEACKNMTDFFITLAACNTVVVTKDPRQDTMTAAGVVIPNETSDKSEKRPRTPSIYFPFSLPTMTQSGPKGLIRSLFPSSRPLSPIAASPSCTPPVTPQESPRHSTTDGNSLHADNGSPIFTNHQTLNNGVSHLAPPESRESFKIPRPNHLTLSQFNDEISLASSTTLIDADLKPFFEAESPDELALVDAAYTYGYRLIHRNIHRVCLMIPGSGVCELEVLHVLPFDSIRKRMSIIVRHPENGEKTLFCKGADNAVLENLSPKFTSPENPQTSILMQHLDTYAKKGLRVLCMARKTLKDSEYEAWAFRHKEAANALANREKKLQQSYCEIESNMELLGATGIEDRLQDGVPETIRALKKAGIVVYVLTGDKQETAVNIAYSCSLFSSDMSILKLNARTLDETRQLLSSFIETADREKKQYADAYESAEYSAINYNINEDLSNNGRTSMRGVPKPSRKGLVVDGRTLVFILDGRTNLRTPFLKLAQHCETVLCCRATPLQKALIVRNVKDKLNVLTLAIGDGANDVSMIQTANVGIGISGVEGRQAVMASDFSITRFRHLEKLLLVHGHWSYDRLCRIILYFFYKNAAVVFILMWYQLYCGFSGTIVIEQLYLTMFSLLFTSLPPIVVGIYNKDAPEELLLSQPKLYARGRLSQLYQPNSFWVNILDAFYQSVVILFLSAYAYESNETGVYELGMTVAHICLVTQSLHLAIEISTWTVLEVSVLIISYALYLIFGVLYTVLSNGAFGLPSMRGELGHMLTSSTQWATFFVAIVLALLPRFIFRAIKNSFFPNDVVKAVIESSARNKGIDRLSKTSSSSSVYRFGSQSFCSREEKIADATSSLVTMTTIVSNQGDAEA